MTLKEILSKIDFLVESELIKIINHLLLEEKIEVKEGFYFKK